jgi:hypothetical protein
MENPRRTAGKSRFLFRSVSHNAASAQGLDETVQVCETDGIDLQAGQYLV